MPKPKDNASYFYRKLAGYRQSLSGELPTFSPGDSGGSDALSVKPSLGDSSAVAGISFLNDTGVTDTIQLSFDGGFLQGVDYDAGTADNPSYTLLPDTTSKTIYVERSNTVTAADNDTEIISFSGNSGPIGAIVFTIADLLATKVRRLIKDLTPNQPRLEFQFAGNLSNTGEGPGVVASQNFNSFVSTERPGVVGIGTQYETNSYLRALCDHIDVTANDSTDRSWIYCWRNVDTVTGTHVSAGKVTTTDNGPGWLKANGHSYFWWQHLTGNGTFFDMDNTASHTVAGNSESLLKVANEVCLVVATYNSAAQELTYRWKQTSHGNGHSYSAPISKSPETKLLQATWYFGGYINQVVHDIDWLYSSVINYEITDSDFDTLYSALTS